MIKSYQNARVAVTGGAGFIGSALTAKLVELGAHVVVIDDLSSGSLDNLNLVADRIIFIQGSITDAALCKQALKNIDIVFHMAAYISVPCSFEQPSLCYEVNIQGTQTLLEAARINHIKRFVFSSSCAVYAPDDKQLSEHSACFPQSPYGLSKFVGELLCKQYKYNFGTQSIILRYFNVWQDDPYLPDRSSGVAAKFRAALHNSKPLLLYGDGSQKRDFVALSTVIATNLKAGIVPYNSLSSIVYNVASGTSISLLELIELLAQQTNCQPIISYKPAHKSDSQAVYANTTKHQEFMSIEL